MTLVSVAMLATFSVSMAIESGYGGGGGGNGGGGFVFSPSYQVNPFTNAPIVNAGNGTVGQVLGASTTAANCEVYMTRYNRLGYVNPSVSKLKAFLNKYENANLGTSNVYNVATRNAVRAYQAKYQVRYVTGIQWNLTTDVINKQYCDYKAQGRGL